MSNLTYTPIGNNESLNVSFKNLSLGELIIKEDGCYSWFPRDDRKGYLSSWVLKDIAAKLDELNGDWEEMIDKMLKEENENC